MAEVNCAIPKAKIDARARQLRVNGVEIARDAIARETQNHAAATPIAAWQAAARALVVRELLLQEARSRQIVPQPRYDAEGRHETDEEAMIARLVEQACAPPQISAALCRDYYAEHRSRFHSAPLVAARHILLAAAPDDHEGRAAARALARDLITVLAERPQDFAALAKAHSACSSAASGGALGQITPGQAVPEFEAKLFALPQGLAPAPIESRYGLHVVLVEAIAPAEPLPFEIVQARIGEFLAAREERRAMRNFIAELLARAEIVGIEIQGQEAEVHPLGR